MKLTVLERRFELFRWINERTSHEGLTAREIAEVSGIYDGVPHASDRCFDDLQVLAYSHPPKVRRVPLSRPARWELP